jgi:hypothetical protein
MVSEVAAVTGQTLHRLVYGVDTSVSRALTSDLDDLHALVDECIDQFLTARSLTE